MPGALQAVPFLSLGLVLATFPHHWRVKNIATLSIIAWLSAYNTYFGVNAILWDGNADIRVPVWCDIATKIKIGANVGLPGCSLCMAKRLNRIAYGVEMAPSGWRHRTLDLLLCWGFPFIVMGLHYIVQGHRFDIIEDFGCIPAIYVSWPSILIIDMSGFIPAILTLLYCGMAIWKLYRRRAALHVMLKKRGAALSPSGYIRLMIMTFVLGTWSVVLISISISNEYSTGQGLQPWISWTYVHTDFSFIGQYLESQLPPPSLRYAYILWWAVPISSLSFFAFFGFGTDAMKTYEACATWVSRVIFRRRRVDDISVEWSVDTLNSSAVSSMPDGSYNGLPSVSLFPGHDKQATHTDYIRPLPPVPYDTESLRSVGRPFAHIPENIVQSMDSPV